MGYRTELAKEYVVAPRRRVGAQQVTVPANDVLNITALVPTHAVAGLAPFIRLIASYHDTAGAGDVLSASLTDNIAVTFITEITNRATFEGLAFADTFRGIEMLIPPQSNTAAQLEARSDGTSVPNFIFLRNDSVADIDVNIAFEIPTLDWAKTTDLGVGRERVARDYFAAPRENQLFFGNQQILAGQALELTGSMPTVEDCFPAPSFDLKVAFTRNLELLVGVIDNAVPVPATMSAYGVSRLTANNAIADVLGLRPRENAAATTLLDGTRVFVTNNAGGNINIDGVVVAIPTLDFK